VMDIPDSRADDARSGVANMRPFSEAGVSSSSTPAKGGGLGLGVAVAARSPSPSVDPGPSNHLHDLSVPRDLSAARDMACALSIQGKHAEAELMLQAALAARRHELESVENARGPASAALSEVEVLDDGRPRPDPLRRTVSGVIERAERLVTNAEARTCWSSQAASLREGDPAPPDSAHNRVFPPVNPRQDLPAVQVPQVGLQLASKSTSTSSTPRCSTPRCSALQGLLDSVHQRSARHSPCSPARPSGLLPSVRVDARPCNLVRIGGALSIVAMWLP
jgi:hypothetical protein